MHDRLAPVAFDLSTVPCGTCGYAKVVSEGEQPPRETPKGTTKKNCKGNGDDARWRSALVTATAVQNSKRTDLKGRLRIATKKSPIVCSDMGRQRRLCSDKQEAEWTRRCISYRVLLMHGFEKGQAEPAGDYLSTS